MQAVFRAAEKSDEREDGNEAIETVDISEAMAVEMFGISPSIEEVLEYPCLLLNLALISFVQVFL